MEIDTNETRDTVGNKKAVASALLFLGLNALDAIKCAEWYCDKIEWASMKETELFGRDCHYSSVNHFKFRTYFWFVIYLMDLIKDREGVEYMLDASWDEWDKQYDEKSKRLRGIMLDAANSKDLMTQDVAVILKLDIDAATELCKLHTRVAA